MQNQVVVLDIGSSKVTALIGERGVNKTFLIKGFSERTGSFWMFRAFRAR